jgi:hypothetical protein
VHVTNLANRDEQAKKHPDRPRSLSAILDISWRQPVVQEIALGQHGVDTVCAYCHTPRADAQAGWRLDRNHLVVQTGR